VPTRDSQIVTSPSSSCRSLVIKPRCHRLRSAYRVDHRLFTSSVLRSSIGTCGPVAGTICYSSESYDYARKSTDVHSRPDRSKTAGKSVTSGSICSLSYTIYSRLSAQPEVSQQLKKTCRSDLCAPPRKKNPKFTSRKRRHCTSLVEKISYHSSQIASPQHH
jgi:hypothetical protein